MSEPYDKVPAAALEQAARNGRAYSGEVKAMARELLELRAKLPEPLPTPIWYAFP